MKEKRKIKSKIVLELGEVLFEALGKKYNDILCADIEEFRSKIKECYGFAAPKVALVCNEKLSQMEFNVNSRDRKLVVCDFAKNNVNYYGYVIMGLHMAVLEHLHDGVAFDCKNIALYNEATGDVVGLSFEYGRDVAPCVTFCGQNKKALELIEIAGKENAAVFYNGELCSKLLPTAEVGKGILKDYECYCGVAKIYNKLYNQHKTVSIKHKLQKIFKKPRG